MSFFADFWVCSQAFMAGLSFHGGRPATLMTHAATDEVIPSHDSIPPAPDALGTCQRDVALSSRGRLSTVQG